VLAHIEIGGEGEKRKGEKRGGRIPTEEEALGGDGNRYGDGTYFTERAASLLLTLYRKEGEKR